MNTSVQRMQATIPNVSISWRDGIMRLDAENLSATGFLVSIKLRAVYFSSRPLHKAQNLASFGFLYHRILKNHSPSSKLSFQSRV